MTTAFHDRLLVRLRTIVSSADVHSLSDTELLHAFVAGCDEAAFAILVQRHGPMVWAACRRSLHNFHDAEDAFQATFLVLARKAGTVTGNLVGHWLYGVAYRICCKLRSSNARRLAKERESSLRPKDAGRESGHDLHEVLDLELQRLPLKYRQAILACDVECKNRKLAAQQLGLREGTLSSRLARGRELLRQRLLRRGVSVTSAALAAFCADHARTAPPVAATAAAIQIGQHVVATGHVAHLARAAIAAMALRRLIVPLAAVLVAGVLAAAFLSLNLLRPANTAVGKSLVRKVTHNPERQSRILLPPQLQAWRRIDVAEPAGNLIFAPNAAFFLATIENQVHLWDAKDAAAITSYRCPINWPHKVILSSDSRHAAGLGDKQAVIWDAQTGAVVSRMNHQDAFYSACFSPDGKYLLTGNGTYVNAQINYINSALHLWEVANGKWVRTFAGLHRPAKAVGFAPDGAILACTTAILTRWDDDSGQVINTLRFRNTGYEYPVFSADGEHCLVPTDHSFGVWRTKDGEKIAEFADQPVHVRWLNTTGDRRFIVTGCSSHNVGRVWDLNDGTKGTELLGHADYIVGAAISPAGRLAVTSSRDRTIRVYRLSGASE